MAESFETPSESELLKVNLEDDVRTFLLKRLAWSRMDPAERERLEELGADIKKMRRPTFIEVSSTEELGPPGTVHTRCHIAAEGVMSHRSDDCIHLAFKCGNPEHKYRYSTFGVATVIALAKACEAAWPGSISNSILEQALENQGLPFPPPVLDPGDDEIDLDEDDEEELELLDEILDDDEDDDIVI